MKTKPSAPVSQACQVSPGMASFPRAGTWNASGEHGGSWIPDAADARRTWMVKAKASREREIALHALMGRHIVFIGDSNTRYLYLSLAGFLKHGVWPGNQDNPRASLMCDPSAGPLSRKFPQWTYPPHVGVKYLGRESGEEHAWRWRTFHNVCGAHLR
jgi:hypothetical protein